MARYERDGRAEPVNIGGKVKFRYDEHGNLVIATPPRSLTETTEAAERPPHADDPRSGPSRDVPPYGAA